MTTATDPTAEEVLALVKALRSKVRSHLREAGVVHFRRPLESAIRVKGAIYDGADALVRANHPAGGALMLECTRLLELASKSGVNVDELLPTSDVVEFSTPHGRPGPRGDKRAEWVRTIPDAISHLPRDPTPRMVASYLGKNGRKVRLDKVKRALEEVNALREVLRSVVKQEFRNEIRERKRHPKSGPRPGQPGELSLDYYFPMLSEEEAVVKRTVHSWKVDHPDAESIVEAAARIEARIAVRARPIPVFHQ